MSWHGFPSKIHCNYLSVWSSEFLKNTPAHTVGWFIRLDFTYQHNTTCTCICPVWEEQTRTSMGLPKLLRALGRTSGNFSTTSLLLHICLTSKYMLGFTISLHIFLTVSISKKSASSQPLTKTKSVNVLLNTSLQYKLFLYPKDCLSKRKCKCSAG